jgi:TetR/AcrR family transcriptional repressor for divergent bdcA
MEPTNKSRPRGRPRRFDPEQAVATAQQLFHARGYDSVSVSDVTEALGINPPSFYSAFGNKAGLYMRVLAHWTGTRAIPLADILRPDRPVAECLAALLEEAARRYAAGTEDESGAGGCMVLEGTRCQDDEAREAARRLNLAAESMICDYIAARHPAEAARLTDYVSTTMSGLSAKARNGHGLDRLLATARLAGLAIPQVLSV